MQKTSKLLLVVAGAVMGATISGIACAQDGLPGFSAGSAASGPAGSNATVPQSLPLNGVADPSLPVPVGAPGGPGDTATFSTEERAYIDARRNEIAKYIFEQNQLQQIEQVLAEQARRKAARENIDQSVPLLPQEIMQARERWQEVDRAKNRPVSGSINMRIRTAEVDLNSTTPVELYVVSGYATSIVFFDQTGAPWPIEGNIVGNKDAFTSEVVTSAKNTATFDIKRPFAETNALVSLVGLNTPLVIKLVGETNTNDSRISIRIPKNGPEAKAQVITTPGINNADPTMMSVLDNPGAVPTTKKFKLVGVPGEVVYVNGQLYVRTDALLISPAWKSQMTSVTGQHVYQIPAVTKLLFSDNGRLVSGVIEEQYSIGLQTKASIFNASSGQ